MTQTPSADATKSEEAPTGRETNIQVTNQPNLRLCLRDAEGNPLKMADVLLSVDGLETRPGKTDDRGVFVAVVPPERKAATLVVAGQKLRLLLDRLDPASEVSGAKARLKNLGYRIPVMDGTRDASFHIAVAMFQADYMKDGITGDLDTQTLAKLEEAHGC